MHDFVMVMRRRVRMIHHRRRRIIIVIYIYCRRDIVFIKSLTQYRIRSKNVRRIIVRVRENFGDK